MKALLPLILLKDNIASSINFIFFLEHIDDTTPYSVIL